MQIENEVTIDAPAGTVWALTLDVEGWPSFTPTMTSVRRLDGGPLAVGSRAVVKQPGQGERTWTVTTLEPPRRFRWETRVLGTRMVGVHEAEPTGDHSCRSRLAVELTGWTSGLLGALLGKQIATAITTENAGLKQRAEQNA